MIFARILIALSISVFWAGLTVLVYPPLAPVIFLTSLTAALLMLGMCEAASRQSPDE